MTISRTIGRNTARRFVNCGRGVAAVEFAIVAPLLLMMFAGTVEIGRIFQVYNATNRLASQYAITYSDCSDLPAGTCNNELSTFGSTSLISNVAPELRSGQITLSMFQVKMSGSTPNVVYSWPNGSAMTSAQISAAQNVLADQRSGVVVTATYAHSLEFFQTLMNPYLSSALTARFTAVQQKD